MSACKRRECRLTELHADGVHAERACTAAPQISYGRWSRWPVRARQWVRLLMHDCMNGEPRQVAAAHAFGPCRRVAGMHAHCALAIAQPLPALERSHDRLERCRWTVDAARCMLDLELCLFVFSFAPVGHSQNCLDSEKNTLNKMASVCRHSWSHSPDSRVDCVLFRFSYSVNSLFSDSQTQCQQLNGQRMYACAYGTAYSCSAVGIHSCIHSTLKKL